MYTTTRELQCTEEATASTQNKGVPAAHTGVVGDAPTEGENRLTEDVRAGVTAAAAAHKVGPPDRLQLSVVIQRQAWVEKGASVA